MKHKKKKVDLSLNIPSFHQWKDCEMLLAHLGAKCSKGRGDRVIVTLNGVKAVFHRQHAHKIHSSDIISLKKFLTNAGVEL